MMPQRLRNILLTLLPIVLLLIVRLAVGSQLELRQANALLAQGAAEEAVLHATRAIRWYFPGNPCIAPAIRLVQQEAEKALQNQQPAKALAMFRQLSAGLYAIRSFYQPYGPILMDTQRRLASLQGNESSMAAPPINQRSTINDPDPFWGFLATSGFVLWIIAVALLIRHGYTAQGALRVNKATFYYLSAVGLLFGVWLFGLWKA